MSNSLTPPGCHSCREVWKVFLTSEESGSLGHLQPSPMNDVISFYKMHPSIMMRRFQKTPEGTKSKPMRYSLSPLKRIMITIPLLNMIPSPQLRKVLPLVHKTCNTSLHVTFLLGRIPKPEKTTQAISVHRKGTFCLYI